MSNPAPNDSLAPIRNRFLEMLEDRQVDIQRDLELALNEQETAAEALARIEGVLHKISGTAGTLGYAALGEGARVAEYAIASDREASTQPSTALFMQIIDVLEMTMDITSQDIEPRIA